MTKTDALHDLLQWFTPGQTHDYFGSRTETELTQLALNMQTMTPGQRERFKSELQATAYRQRVSKWRHLRRNKRSMFGRMLLANARDAITQDKRR